MRGFLKTRSYFGPNIRLKLSINRMFPSHINSYDRQLKIEAHLITHKSSRAFDLIETHCSKT